MKNWMVFICALVLCSCAPEQKKAVTIHLENDLAKEANLKLSDLVSSIEYIPLETHTDGLVDERFGVLLFANEVAVVNGRRCLLFDRKTGKFIKEVLHCGNDPEGYQATMLGSGLLGNETNGYIFFRESNRNVSTYDYQTGERKRIPCTGGGSAIAYLDDHTFAEANLNLLGTNPTKMWFYRDYQCVDSIPNHELFEWDRKMLSIYSHENMFYRSGGKTFYKYLFNDTVYQVNPNSITPAYWFESTKLPRLEFRAYTENMNNRMMDSYWIDQMAEDEDCIFYTMNYQKEPYHMIFDKRTGEGGVLKQDIVNDIDGGINLWVDHITDRGEYVFIVQPHLLDSEELEKYQLKEDDNPMIVVGYKK